MSSTTASVDKSTINATSPVTPVVRKSKIPRALTWSDPLRSGTILGEILAVLFVVRYGNLLRLALRLSCWAIGTTAAVEFATRWFNGSSKGWVSSYQPSQFIKLNQHSLEKYTNRALASLTEGLTEFKKLLDAEDLSLSAVAFFTTFAMYVLTAHVSFSTLTFIATIVSFTVPPLYLQFQKEIDEFVAVVHKHAHTHAQRVQKQAQEAVGPHVEVARAHIDNLASKVGIKLNRGGFPETPADKKAVPVATASEIPGSPAKSNIDAVSSKAPKVSATSEGVSIDGVNYDSVPTLAGNVNLKKDVPVSAFTDDLKNAANETHAAASVTADKLGDSVEDLASDLKSSLDNDKKLDAQLS